MRAHTSSCILILLLSFLHTLLLSLTLSTPHLGKLKTGKLDGEEDKEEDNEDEELAFEDDEDEDESEYQTLTSQRKKSSRDEAEDEDEEDEDEGEDEVDDEEDKEEESDGRLRWKDQMLQRVSQRFARAPNLMDLVYGSASVAGDSESSAQREPVQEDHVRKKILASFFVS